MNKGILLALSGYLMWGCFPIYWALLNHVNPSEVLVHRMLWSVPVLFFLVYSKPFMEAQLQGVFILKERIIIFIDNCDSHYY
jgi:chloramphenicol-sensitive protein RarD